jgi:hypothetical protein
MQTVRILGKIFTIQTVPETEFTGDVWGRICCMKQIIYLRDGSGPDQARETLLHECLHGLDYSMSLGLEEGQVHALAAGLYGLLRDNPPLLALLSEGIDDAAPFPGA